MKTRSRGQDRAAVISFESGRSAASGQAAWAFGSGSQFSVQSLVEYLGEVIDGNAAIAYVLKFAASCK